MLSTPKDQRPLRLALLGNALFSAVSAAECLLFRDAVAQWTGLSAAQVQALGFDLALFAGFLAFVLTRPDLGTRTMGRVVQTIIALDVLWVVGSVALLLVDNPLTTAGQWTVALVALVVADFAYFQWHGLRKLRAARRTGGTERTTPTLGQADPVAPQA